MEPNLEEIKILKEYPYLKQNIEVFNHILLPLERWLFKRILQEKKPITTRKFYSIMMIDLISFFLTDPRLSDVELSLDDIKYYGRVRKNLEKEDIKLIIVDDRFLSSDKKDLKDIVISFVQQSKNFKGKSGGYPMSETDNISIIEETFKKFKVPYYSYNKIESDLERLEKWGVLITRKEGRKKYWIINPKFYHFFKNNIKQILKS